MKKEAVMASFEVTIQQLPGQIKENHENLCQNISCPSWFLIQATVEYKSASLPLKPALLVKQDSFLPVMLLRVLLLQWRCFRGSVQCNQ
jgi:hypothetical protein